MKANSILATIGQTPHLRLNQIFRDFNAEVWVKLERANPGGSIKDRIALQMIEDAERRGLIKPHQTPRQTIVEPTSGNTGIGLAMVCAVKGYDLILVMPESMSVERRKLMQCYGARFELTPREKGMRGAIEKAAELAKELNAWCPAQFENPSNIEVHRMTTAREILEDFSEGLDYLVTGVGTGGHITGCALELKPVFPGLKVLAVEPSASPVLSGGSHSPHPIQGIGAGFIPENCQKELLDGIVQVDAAEAYNFAKRAAKEEGLLIGVSSGASLAAVNKLLAARESKEKVRVLTFCYDTGERYLSVADFCEN